MNTEKKKNTVGDMTPEELNEFITKMVTAKQDDENELLKSFRKMNYNNQKKLTKFVKKLILEQS